MNAHKKVKTDTKARTILAGSEPFDETRNSEFPETAAGWYENRYRDKEPSNIYDDMGK